MKRLRFLQFPTNIIAAAYNGDQFYGGHVAFSRLPKTAQVAPDTSDQKVLKICLQKKKLGCLSLKHGLHMHDNEWQLWNFETVHYCHFFFSNTVFLMCRYLCNNNRETPLYEVSVFFFFGLGATPMHHFVCVGGGEGTLIGPPFSQGKSHEPETKHVHTCWVSLGTCMINN